jgi:hypothetical protein
LGVWLRLDGDTFHADVQLRPFGDDDLDAVAAELFGELLSQLPAPAASCWPSTAHG